MRHCWGTTTMPRTRSGHDRDRSRDHPLRGIAPVKGHYTRSERVQCLRIGCTTPRHRLTCGPARMEVDGPDRLSWARRRSPDSQRGPETAGPGGASRQRTERARRRARTAGHTYAEPGRGAHIQRARARGTHTTRPGPAARNSTTEPRPREKIKPSDPP